ncbi:MAG: 50S ribosomal protein L15 [Chlorobiaceae bacterium]|nr:50S ribosomal protein L15 [Chlorobiaceae bacterium]MBA4310134.1 50S ribosomal protein L15 [Chlorobiaceae bacterium]
MNYLGNLKYAEGSRKKTKRIGRGEGSGHGGTSTKGMNGQMSRSGANYKAWFEGGQMPLQRRIPKFGFTSPFKTEFELVNVAKLQLLSEKVDLSKITITNLVLKQYGLIKTLKKPFKVLGEGELKSKLNIEANACSENAKQKIEAAGGTLKIV